MKERSVCRNICPSYKEIQVNGVPTGTTVLFGERDTILGATGKYREVGGTCLVLNMILVLYKVCFSMILKYHEVE